METGKTPAQVVLRWHLQQGTIVIPKSAHPDRIRENAALYDFSLSEVQMSKIDGVERDHSISPWRSHDGVGWY